MPMTQAKTTTEAAAKVDRRAFLRGGGFTVAGALAQSVFVPDILRARALRRPKAKADYTLRIEPASLEIAPGVLIRTTAYNGQVPGPILRLGEGAQVTIDVINAREHPDLVHRHGLAIDSLNDGAIEEGSPLIAPGGLVRYGYTARPAGTRWYHTHAGAGADLSRGTNPVPHPASVDVLSVAVAKRVDSIVQMSVPGVWVLGSTLPEARKMGLGIVVEYAGKSGAPVWTDPAAGKWDYSLFASSAPAPAPDEIITLTFRDVGPEKGSKFDTWTINNKSWPDVDPVKVSKGQRYRLILPNGSGDQHPIHLHRHTFEVTQIGRKTLSGLRKDVINVMPLDTVAVGFVADNPGDTLLHCHQQLHRDYGFILAARKTPPFRAGM